MNKHFGEAGKKLVNNFGIFQNFKYVIQTASNSFIFTDIDEDQMRKEIQKLKINKASGTENLKSERLKTICDCILETFTYIGNRCINQGVYLAAFKNNVVIPLFKKRNDTDPISLI